MKAADESVDTPGKTAVEKKLPPPPKLTTHLVQIEQAAHDVMMGQISVSDFARLVVRLEQIFSVNLGEVREIQVPADFQDEVAEELDVGQHGIEHYLQAMAAFHEYIRTRNLDALQKGLRMSREANEMVNQALLKNWQTYETYQQAAQEYLRQMSSQSQG